MLNAGGGADTVNVRATSGPLTVNAGAGGDAFTRQRFQHARPDPGRRDGGRAGRRRRADDQRPGQHHAAPVHADRHLTHALRRLGRELQRHRDAAREQGQREHRGHAAAGRFPGAYVSGPARAAGEADGAPSRPGPVAGADGVGRLGRRIGAGIDGRGPGPLRVPAPLHPPGPVHRPRRLHRQQRAVQVRGAARERGERCRPSCRWSARAFLPPGSTSRESCRERHPRVQAAGAAQGGTTGAEPRIFRGAPGSGVPQRSRCCARGFEDTGPERKRAAPSGRPSCVVVAIGCPTTGLPAPPAGRRRRPASACTPACPPPRCSGSWWSGCGCRTAAPGLRWRR